jgi:hypothetical protein
MASIKKNISSLSAASCSLYIHVSSIGIRKKSQQTVKKPFENLAKLTYLGKMLTNENLIRKEIKSKLKSGNNCYQSVRSFTSAFQAGCLINSYE